MPLISVIIPIYNESIHDLKGSILSILNQNYTNIECILVDDNPHNIYIKCFIKKLADKDYRIKILINSHNLKLVNSENKGIRHSKGKYIARMDADDIATKNRLISQFKFLINNNLDLVCSNCALMDINGDIIKRHLFSKITQYRQKNIRHIMSYCNIANGPTLFFKKNVFNRIQGYRVPLIDDYDFASRALIHHFKLGYQSKDLIIKRYRMNSISNENVLKQFNDVLVLSKFLRKTKFTRVPSVDQLKRVAEIIKKSDNKKFHNFIKYRKGYKKNHSIIDLYNSVRIMLSSKIIFKRVLWNNIIAKRQDVLMKN